VNPISSAFCHRRWRITCNYYGPCPCCSSVALSALTACVRVRVCVCVCVCMYVCIYILYIYTYIYVHNTHPLKLTLQVLCSVHMFTPTIMTLVRTIFTQWACEFNSLFLSGPENPSAVRHSMIHAIDMHYSLTDLPTLPSHASSMGMWFPVWRVTKFEYVSLTDLTTLGFNL